MLLATMPENLERNAMFDFLSYFKSDINLICTPCKMVISDLLTNEAHRVARKQESTQLSGKMNGILPTNDILSLTI